MSCSCSPCTRRYCCAGWRRQWVRTGCTRGCGRDPTLRRASRAGIEPHRGQSDNRAPSHRNADLRRGHDPPSAAAPESAPVLELESGSCRPPCVSTAGSTSVLRTPVIQIQHFSFFFFRVPSLSRFWVLRS